MASPALTEGRLSIWFKEVNQGGDVCIQLRPSVFLSLCGKSGSGNFA
jgi:hypothetical protein